MQRVLLATILIAATAPLWAHHSFGAEYDANQPITLTGTVTKVEWTNPHVYFYIDVKDEKTGKVTNWALEMGAPAVIQRSGWKRTSMKIGDLVIVDGFQAKNGLPHGNARTVTLASTGSRPCENHVTASTIDPVLSSMRAITRRGVFARVSTTPLAQVRSSSRKQFVTVSSADLLSGSVTAV